MKMRHFKVTKILSFFLCCLVMASAAIITQGRILGHDLKKEKPNIQNPVSDSILVMLPDGECIINTSFIASGILGYGGTVPLRIHVDRNEIITLIEPLDNSESPEFFNRAKTLFKSWEGKSIDEALHMKVDAISGATFSSEAIKGNIESGLQFLKKNSSFKERESLKLSASSVVAAIVALMGAVIPFFRVGRKWHLLQQILNVLILGFWSGTFVSYALLINLFTNGVNMASLMPMLASLIVLIVAFVYPLFGKNGYYCVNICPFGAAQEVVGMLNHKKYIMSKRVIDRLTMFRLVLWGILLFLMLAGIFTIWKDYELFTAFLVSSAPIWVLVVAMVFLALSLFIPRPYCRFVCPTGTLMKLIQ